MSQETVKLSTDGASLINPSSFNKKLGRFQDTDVRMQCVAYKETTTLSGIQAKL